MAMVALRADDGAGSRRVSAHSGRSGNFSPVPKTLITSNNSFTGSLISSAIKAGFGAGVGTYAYNKLGASAPSSAALGSLLSGASPATAKVVSDAVKFAPSVPSVSSVPSGSSAPSVPSVPSGSSAPSADPVYLNADLAKVYGMDVPTAYQEALSNTSYQRAVKDLQAAGLNPVLAASSLSPAGGVYNPQVLTSDGSGYPFSGVSRGPGGVSAGVSSAKGSHYWYKTLSNVGTIGGLAVGLYTSKSPYGAFTGATVGRQVLGSVGNLIDQILS